MKDPLISFISINYNGFKDTCELIDSIIKHIQSVTYEIIIIDNASTKDEATMLKEKFPNIFMIKSHKNLGFSGGNNLGIKHAKGNFLFLINNDTFILNDEGLIDIIDKLNSDPKVGGVSPKIKYAAPPYNIQFAGFTRLSSITLRNSTIGLGEPDKHIYNITKETPYLHGAAMIIKKEVIKKVGYMPDIYFLYYEELDWCTQITQAGYSLWYSPSMTIYHKESQSTGKMSQIQLFYMTRNRLLYAWRNLRGIRKWFSIVYQILIPPIKSCIAYLFKGRYKSIKTVYCGIYEFVFLPNKQRKI